MSRIVITEFMDLPAVDRLRAAHDVLYDPELVEQSERLLAAAAEADALIVRNRTQVRGGLLAALARCRVVGRLGVGLDNLDLPGCKARGIKVIPATGANAVSVAEYVLCTAMLLRRGAYSATGAVANGQWPRNALSAGLEIGGATLGLVGFGSIGQTTARLARAWGLSVLAHDPSWPRDHPIYAHHGVRAATLDELLAAADVVSLHLPLTDATRGLFDADRLARIKPDAVLVNTARGGIVDEHALADALRAGRLRGAALDVFETEPLPAAEHFRGLANLILTPHVAGLTAQANARVSALIAERVLSALVPTP